jgi:hypothetical protein
MDMLFEQLLANTIKQTQIIHSQSDDILC